MNPSYNTIIVYTEFEWEVINSKISDKFDHMIIYSDLFPPKYCILTPQSAKYCYTVSYPIQDTLLRLHYMREEKGCEPKGILIFEFPFLEYKNHSLDNHVGIEMELYNY